MTKAKNLIVVLMGSERDFEHAKKIGSVVKDFGVPVEYRVASAHRTPKKLLGLLDKYHELAARGTRIIFVCVVGLSNALSGLVAATTHLPVVTCPPDHKDLLSSLRMPRGVAHATALDPENAALCALKNLALFDPALTKKLMRYLDEKRKAIEAADKRIRKN